MDCTKCTTKACRKLSPCVDNSMDYIDQYQKETVKACISAASLLVNNGRAGTLNRLEEIVEYSKIRGFRKLGVAYCYGLEKEATILRKYLAGQGFHVLMVSCTVDGISETRINPAKCKEVVSCNPIGQAVALNKEGVEFVLLMGLCLGHDILVQKNLQADFTTFIVKDRVYKHNPLMALNGIEKQSLR